MLNETIKQYRKEMKLTQEQLADTRIRTVKMENGQTELDSKVCPYFRSNQDSV